MELLDLIKVLISPIITIVTFLITYRLSLKNNRLTQENTREQARMSILPFIDISLVSPADGEMSDATIYIELPENAAYTSEELKLTNIGQATAVNVTVSVSKESSAGEFEYGNIANGTSVSSNIHFQGKENSEYTLEVAFSDLQGRKYRQLTQLQLLREAPGIHRFNAAIKDLAAPELLP